jgi:flagellar P-ring protein precursor FlgI
MVLVKRILISVLTILMSNVVNAERIKDISNLEGVRGMPLVGYGLVVGLNGTGDGNINHTQASLRRMLDTMGIKVGIGEKIRSKNVASVMVSSKLPAFARIGHKLDLAVTSIGDAKSIKDGVLLMTTLKGIDGEKYAIAAGSVISSGLSDNKNDRSFLSKNRVGTGVINNGGTVEKKWDLEIGGEGVVRILLKRPDFSTSQNIANAINKVFGEGVAVSEDSLSVRYRVGSDRSMVASMVAMVENIDVVTAQASAKVVVNSHTGTVVISSNVFVKEVVVTHGNLTVEVLADDGKKLVEGEILDLGKKEKTRAFTFSSGVSLKELVNNINKLGIGPSDLVAILQSLREAGAMQADLIII